MNKEQPVNIKDLVDVDVSMGHGDVIPNMNIPLPDESDIEPFLEFKGDPEDKFDTLAEFYHYSLQQFCYMISREVPEKFRGKKKQENYSNIQGIKAFKDSIRELRMQRDGKKVRAINMTTRRYRHLHQWYHDSIILFITESLKTKHEKFKDENEINSMLKAFALIIVDMKADNHE